MSFLVISCGSAKKNEACPARELYTGGLFITNRRYAERYYEGRWFILSGKHGLLDPDAITEPYDTVISDIDVPKLKGKVYFLGSKKYADVLRKRSKVIHLLKQIAAPGLRQKYINLSIKKGVKLHKLKLPPLPVSLQDVEVEKMIKKGLNIDLIRLKGSCCQARYTRLKHNLSYKKSSTDK